MTHAAPQDLHSQPNLKFDFTLATEGFRAWGDAGLKRRELGLGEASDGLVRAELIRADGEASSSTATLRAEGHTVLYVLRGNLTVSALGVERRAAKAGCSVYLPPEAEALLEGWSFDLDLLVLHASAGSAPAERTAIFNDESEDSYARGGPGREYLAFRHLRLADRTERQFEMTIITGLVAPPGGTGWHRHSNFEWVYVIGGSAELQLHGRGTTTIRAGDSLTIPPGTVHSVSAFSNDYSLVSLNLPADFKTESLAEAQI